jgi:hypothetical protein
MGKSIDIVTKISDIGVEARKRKESYDHVDDDFDFEGATRYCRCSFCDKETEQRVDERTIVYEVGDRCNRSFHERTFDTVVGWWCNECEDEIQIISKSPSH